MINFISKRHSNKPLSLPCEITTICNLISDEGKKVFGTEYLAVSPQGSQDPGLLHKTAIFPGATHVCGSMPHPPCTTTNLRPKLEKQILVNPISVLSQVFVKWLNRRKLPEIPHKISCNVIKVSFWEPPRWPRLLRYKLCRAWLVVMEADL